MSSPTPEQKQAVLGALERLRTHYGVSSNHALAKKLKKSGLRTSWKTIWNWTNERWNDNDFVLIAALTDTCSALPAAENCSESSPP
jgi:hypothetical protein